MVTKGYIGTSINEVLDIYDPSRDQMPNNPYDPTGDPNYEEFPTIIPDYLEPIGDTGFFVTPDEPADPWDCQRYPRSPYCGGPGIDPQSVIEVTPFSIDPSISANDCEICLTVDGTFFFIALAEGNVCYRSKRPECQPPPPPPIEPPPPPPPPGGNGGSFTPFNGPKLGKRCTGAVELEGLFFNPDQQKRTPRKYYFAGPISQPSGVYSDGLGRYALSGYLYLEFDAPQTTDWLGSGGYDSKILRFIPSNPDDPECQPVTDDSPPPPSPPPPPPPTTGCPCMSCCKPSENDDNNELLRLIAKRLGAYSYPVSTPKWLVTNQGSSSVKHQSLTELLVWTIQQMDALAGEFPIKVEIEDADPTKEGDQKKSVSLPNIAESLAEIYGLTAKTSIDSDLHTSFLMRLAVETIATKTAALIAQDYASANASYLGYKGNEVKRRVQYSFNPEGTESIEDILKDTVYNIKGWRNEDSENAADYLQKIMFACGVMKAAFFRGKPDIERVINGLKDFIPGEGGAQDEEWKNFLRQMNSPDSVFNSGSPAKPEIDDIPFGQPPSGR